VNPAFGVAAAAAFVWLGMVLSISFIEAPLKFRAPGVTPAIGLGIGRLVFRALNVCELVLAAAMLASFAIQPPTAPIGMAAGVAVVALLVQLLAIRPALARRSAAALAGAEGPRSRAHWVYVGLELVKFIALLITGVLILAA
jgi:hypothetical protein